ncbi:hypothetical protein ACHAXR_012335 [Thalassiosira sp. AJA248-18]
MMFEADSSSPRRNNTLSDSNDARGQAIHASQHDEREEGSHAADHHDVSTTHYSHAASSPKPIHRTPMHLSCDSSPPNSMLRKRTSSIGNSSSSGGDIHRNNYNQQSNDATTNSGSDDSHHCHQNNNSQPQGAMNAYNSQQQQQSTTTSNNEESKTAQDTHLLQQFWRTYDTIIILSIFAVFGIMVRMMSATWFRMELGVVFSEDSALGTNLPLNIWSCFLMGLLCSGREAMGIVHSKVLGGANPYGSGRGILEVGRGAYRGVLDAGKAGINRARGYGNVRGETNNNTNSPLAADNYESSPSNPGLRRRRGIEHITNNSRIPQSVEEVGQSLPHTTTPNLSSNRSTDNSESIAGLMGLDDEFRIVGSHQNSEDEIREVQLRGLTRRIMASPSLVFFPAGKEEKDVMEHYENGQLSPSSPTIVPGDQFEIGGLNDDGDEEFGGDIEMSEQTAYPSGEASGEASGEGARSPSRSSSSPTELQQLSPVENYNDSSSNIRRQASESNSTIEEQVDEMIHSISENVTTLRRIHLLDGWNVETEKMKHIILLGLRVGFCGALSTFSSLNASMIRLLRAGSVGEALMGYMLSIQLGIVSYRMGQHLAVYIFVWRCRRETKRDEKRGGYGLRLHGSDIDDEQEASTVDAMIDPNPEQPARQRYVIPSVRTIATLLFITMFVSLCFAIHFSPKHQQYWLSLLFTPLGCLARWKLMSQYNKNLPGFPLGTFSCNLLSCALSGSLGSFLAGNPGPEESIVLTSMIAGFAGSLSTFATFIVEILSLIDPILFKFDGMVYAMITIVWAIIIGFLGSQAKNWADEI